MNLSIDKIVDFLREYNSDEYRRVERDRPLNASLTGGGDDQSLGDEEIKYRLNVAKSGLANVVAPSQMAFDAAKGKLKKLNTWQLIGQIVVLLSGATILGTIQSTFAKDWGYFNLIAPSLVLIGSIITLVHKNKSQAWIGGETLDSLCGKLLSANTSAKMMLINIDILNKFYDRDKAKTVIDESNKLIIDLTDTITKIG